MNSDMERGPFAIIRDFRCSARVRGSEGLLSRYLAHHPCAKLVVVSPAALETARQYVCKAGVNRDNLQSLRHYKVMGTMKQKNTDKDNIFLYNSCLLLKMIKTNHKIKGKDYYKAFLLLPVFLLNGFYLQ